MKTRGIAIALSCLQSTTLVQKYSQAFVISGFGQKKKRRLNMTFGIKEKKNIYIYIHAIMRHSTFQHRVSNLKPIVMLTRLSSSGNFGI